MVLEVLLPPTRLNYQEFLHNSYIMWVENDTQILHGLIHVTWDIHPCPSTSNHGQPPSWEVCRSHFNIKDSNHWPPKGCFWICNGCSSERKTSRTCPFHKDCDVGLCLSLLQVVSIIQDSSTEYLSEWKVTYSNGVVWCATLIEYKSSGHNNSN